MKRLDSTSFARKAGNNPFPQWPFGGRQRELQDIYRCLRSDPPQSCVIIGETFIGKTTLLRHLVSTQEKLSKSAFSSSGEALTCVYLDCSPYTALTNSGAYASKRFWRDLYTKIKSVLLPGQLPSPEKTRPDADLAPVDMAYEIKSETEELIQDYQRPVIIILDNFEGIAGLPMRDSEWLRSIVQQHRCAYIAASRYLLYLSYHYHPENIISPSPLWNLFSDPIYLGLLAEDEVKELLTTVSKDAKEQGSIWKEEDLVFIRNFVGRHPELLRIACARLFEQRLQPHFEERGEERDFLEYSISMDASLICDWLWRSLADPELRGEPRATSVHREKKAASLSSYQQVLMAIAKGHDVMETVKTKEAVMLMKEMLFTLEQRGLIELRDEQWHVFSELMRQFLLKQEYKSGRSEVQDILQIFATQDKGEATATNNTAERVMTPSFTYLEAQVYNYLQAHIGKVCSREEIKQAVWNDSPPTNSALQKIIERIRVKIEPQPDNPRYLIAVRGQGYMLRDSIDTSTMM
jgi:hypothetical protein